MREAGLEIVGEADTAADALELASTLLPAAIILDLQLLDGSGMDILTALKANTPAPLVAVLTNAAHPVYRRRCLELGADFFFDESRDFDALAPALVALQSS